MVERLKGRSLADQVFEKLESDIVQGIYPRGEILTELKLVEQLGVSRTPIREALRRLEQERLIEETGKGSRVLGITWEDMEDIMLIRERVEGVAASYAAARATEADKAELQHLVELQGFYLQKRDEAHLGQLDDQFHRAICRICGRTVISDVLIGLNRKIRRCRYETIQDPGRMEETYQEHMAICQAIQAGDGERAMACAERHVRNIRLCLLAQETEKGEVKEG